MVFCELDWHCLPLKLSNGGFFTFRRKIKLTADRIFSILRLSRKLLHKSRPACSIIWCYIILSTVNVVPKSHDAITYRFVMASLGEHRDILMHRELRKVCELLWGVVGVVSSPQLWVIRHDHMYKQTHTPCRLLVTRYEGIKKSLHIKNEPVLQHG
jgi:hypothetical protein